MSDGYSQPSPHRVDSGGRASFFLGGEQFSSEYQGFPKASQMAAETGLPTFSCVSEVDIPDVDDDDRRMISVGICAMGKKSKSQPMQEILDRLDRFEYIKTIIFAEETIMNEPVENWPICDCLISFYSKGFCLDKAIQYEKLRRPFSLNDLPLQYDIQDRRAVYKILKENDIDHPRFAILDRESGEKKVRLDHWSDHQVIEGDDQIEVNSIIFQKPFVEKPVSAEDHNVFIYFPTSAGGGSQRLFRKIGSRSSVYSPVSRIRKAGSYIYEDFMPTDGTDVKVYTLGPDYAHAEARKSPALDGKVERDKNGKEVRYPVILNAAEKLMARKVCLAFKQTVCGFDLLRASGKSYVCDVNGFSFVKNSAKYYDDSAKILGNMIMRRLAPQLSIPWSIAFQPEDIPIVPTTYGTMMELRCVIAVIRHGDRTPKQKMKMEVKHKKFFDLFEKYHGYETGHLKLKRPKQLQEVLDISRFLLAEFNTNHNPEIEEKKSKLEQLKSVLEMYGHFSGINRKVQLKYQPNGRPKRSSSEEDAPREPSLVLILKWGGELTPAGKVQAEELGKAFRCMYPGGEGDYGQCPGLGLLRLHSTFRHDLKIYASDEGRVQMTAAAFAKGLLDLEGELTPILVQMVKVGNLNKMLDSATTASVSACPTPSPANSVNSDKGLLALEGELTPILVQMVKSANTNGLLDNDNQCLSKYQNITVTSEGGLRAKEKLRDVFHQNREFTDEDYEKLAPTASSSLINAMKFIQNPFRMCHRVYEIIGKLTKRIKGLKQDPVSKEMKLYHGETWELMMRRWGKLEKDFKQKNDRFDISKIPDIYDCIKYDLQHNQTVLQFEQANELHTCSKALADIIVPQEYGITKDEKIQIAQSICTPLLKKIKCDLERNTEEESTRLDARYSKGVSTPHRHVRTRLYFTSESHIHSLLTLIKHGELCDERYDKQWQRAMDYVAAISELNYMTQIVIMMYEDPTKEPTSEERFHVELHFSPGAQTCETDMNYPILCGYRSQLVKKKSGDLPEKVPEEHPERHVRIISPSITPESTSDEDAHTKQRDDASQGSETLRDKDPSLSSSMETLKSPSTDSLSVTGIDLEIMEGNVDRSETEEKFERGTAPKLDMDVINEDSDDSSRKRSPVEEVAGVFIKPAKIDRLSEPRRVHSSPSNLLGESERGPSRSAGNENKSRPGDADGKVEFSSPKYQRMTDLPESMEFEEIAEYDGRRRHHSDPEKNKEHVDSEDGGSSRRKSSSPVTIQQVKSKTRHKSEENLSLSETGSPRSHSFEEKHSCSFEETGSETVADRRKKAAKTKRRVHKRAMSAGLPNAASYPNIARVNHKLALSFYASQKGSTDPDAASTDTNSVAQKHPDITRVNQQLALNTSLNNRRNSLASAPTTLDLLYLPGQMHVRHSFATLFAQTLSDVGKGARGGLISTKVISGSASAPDLMEVDRVKLRAGQGLETRVPAIRPLETLHNSLTLKQVEAFVDNLIAKTPPTPPLHSGHHSSTSSTPRSKTKPSSTIPVTAYSYSSSTSSSAGPSSPTSVSTPEDIAIKLRLLMDSAAGPIVSLDDVSFYSPASSVSSTPTTPASSQSLSSASSSQNFSLNKS
ncbi:inositol hexakisphosphate and diphosphoinositol-pentakisphosphate kinase 2-like isoform X5 [Lineus longissimus]|uniref:inositol hexakisphosphate and diphosphoinositol-pentakisphosphate kinase 2-like isoform X5 n=1 Tax=Lineus longissimus TaxID=88925 RepID=UPI00315D010A